MINVIDDFYPKPILGLMALKFLNLPFQGTWQSNQQYFHNREQAYPCYETFYLEQIDYGQAVFKEEFKKHTNIDILHMTTFLRKTKLEELKKSPSWGEHRQHIDPPYYDLAGLIYFNANSLKDGTRMYSNDYDYEPTLIVGAKVNRCIFYRANTWHCPSMEQTVAERWVQPFMLITSEEKYKRYQEHKKTKDI